jgi:Tol biopolymer transport system component
MSFERHAFPGRGSLTLSGARRRGVEGLRCVLLALAALALPACEEDINDDSATPAVTRRASVGPAGQQANRESDFPDVSADGRYVVFQTRAANLAPGDSGTTFDVFRKDLLTGQLALVSATQAGVPGDGDSTNASISGDGNLVAFETAAANLDPDDTDFDANRDVYVKNLTTGEIVHVSQSSSGGPPSGSATVQSFSPRFSSNGRFLAFISNGEDLDADVFNLLQDFEVFVRDLRDGTTSLVSLDAFGEPVGGTCARPSVSDDGLFVAFETTASLAPGDGNAPVVDVYVRDRQGGTNERISVGLVADPTVPSIAARITPSGRFVVFESEAPELVADDLNGVSDVFVRDREGGGTTRRVTVGTGGSEAAGASSAAVISGDGRFVAYQSFAPNLVEDDTNALKDYFWTDLQRGVTRRLNVRSGGAQSVGRVGAAPALTADGRYAGFVSSGGDLATGDTNGLEDVFVRGPLY